MTVTTEGFRRADRHEVERRGKDSPSRLLLWLIIRVTALLLSVLVLGHFAVTHIVNDVAETDAEFISRRWGSVLWLAWDALLLLSAMAHGTAGVWIVIDDYTPPGRRRRWLRRVLLVVAISLTTLGVYTIAEAILGSG